MSLCMLKGYACAVLMILSETDGMEWRMDNIAIAKKDGKKETKVCLRI